MNISVSAVCIYCKREDFCSNMNSEHRVYRHEGQNVTGVQYFHGACKFRIDMNEAGARNAEEDAKYAKRRRRP